MQHRYCTDSEKPDLLGLDLHLRPRHENFGTESAGSGLPGVDPETEYTLIKRLQQPVSGKELAAYLLFVIVAVLRTDIIQPALIINAAQLLIRHGPRPAHLI